MESNPFGTGSALLGRPDLFNHFLHFLLAFGSIPERRSGLSVNKCSIFVPWLMLRNVFTSVFSLLSPLVHQVTCQRRARRTAGPRLASTTRWTAATTPMTPGSTMMRWVWRKTLTPPPGVCFHCNPSVLCAGGLLHRRQGGLHRRSQRLAGFPDDRHRHSLPLPVSRGCKMLLNVFSPHLEPLQSSRPTPPAFYGGFIVFFRHSRADFAGLFTFDLILKHFSNKQK